MTQEWLVTVKRTEIRSFRVQATTAENARELLATANSDEVDLLHTDYEDEQIIGVDPMAPTG